MDFQQKDRNLAGFIKNILICVLNKSIICLEQHESQ